jgi:hypothetical protein
MNIFKNRHVLVAALVAPVLALIAYFASDYFFGEAPQVAVEGQSYPLVEKPGCRWESGYCGLKNNEFELDLLIREVDGETLLLLESAFALQGVMLSVGREGVEGAPPVPMQAADDEGRRWTLPLTVAEPGLDRIRLVAAADGSLYYGDASTAFMRSGASRD